MVLNFKMVLASFALVFIAELGDKTQLTALAFSASSRSPWSVFLGTSLALVCTSALAVLLGGVLAAHVPEKLIQILAAIMFVAVGVGLLVNVARRAPDKAPGGTPPVKNTAFSGPPTSPAYRLVIEQARHFEEDTARFFFSLAKRAPSGPLRDTLERIAQEEIEHGHSLSGADDTVRAVDPQALFDGDSSTKTSHAACVLPPVPTWHDTEKQECDEQAGNDRGRRQLLEQALAVEESAADFYLALSRLSTLPSLRRAFRQLAVEELQHVNQLTELLDGGVSEPGTGTDCSSSLT